MSKNTTSDETQSARSIPRWRIHYKGMDAEAIRRGFLNNLEYSIAKDKFTLTSYDEFLSLAYTVRERLIERWILTQQQYHSRNARRVYYLSLEFLMGRLLRNNMHNLGVQKSCDQAMDDLDFDLEDINDQEYDAGLGNGGLGRLAACFLDSMATMKLPAMGYGIRYEFGIFTQKIVNGFQKELPEHWLQFGNPWEIERPEYRFRVRFNGRTVTQVDDGGVKRVKWVDTEDVAAIPYDTPIPGFDNNTVNTLRLWAARSVNELDLEQFQAGDYIAACENKLSSENISKVLYPNDSNHSGRELRLKQQYFFTSASLQDIIRRFRTENDDMTKFADYTVIQLNDTHPAIAIVELLRLLLDEHKIEWDEAWEIVNKTFAYTNHTLMPEALEKWSVSLMEHLLPRHMQLIYDINHRFLRKLSYKYPGDTDRIRRMSLIEEDHEPQVRMAYLAIVASHSVNGVAQLHTKLLTEGLMRDFYEMWPEKFNNKTNGITQRRWLHHSNGKLAALITDRIGDGWLTDLTRLRGLEKYVEDPDFRDQWRSVKHVAKVHLAAKLKKWHNITIDPNTMIDVQVKRIHEYKRQLLNAFHCIHLYDKIKNGDIEGFVPRTVIFGGKAAPGYHTAKLIIKFINNIAETVANDPATRGLLQVQFVPNYRVTTAEVLIPAADISEQISTAGTEASGTGNMKFALNGALTVGTMDGANIEMLEEVGEDNMFIFGMHAEEVDALRARGYDPNEYLRRSPSLRRVVDLVQKDYFSPMEPQIFKPLIDSLLHGGDRFMVFADFDAYVECHEKAEAVYRDSDEWTRKSILNAAAMGKFSSDRTIREYVDDIWKVESIDINLDG